MARIKNIEDLRNSALDMLEKVKSGEIDKHEAAVATKLYDNVLSSLKTEMDYHKMLDQAPVITFLEGAKILKDVNPSKLLIENKSTPVVKKLGRPRKVV